MEELCEEMIRVDKVLGNECVEREGERARARTSEVEAREREVEEF